MKRSIIALGAVALLALSACGGTGTGESASSTTSGETTAVDSSETSEPAAEETAEESTEDAPEETTDEEAAEGDAGSLDVWVDDTRITVLADVAADFEATTGVKINLIEKDFGDIRDDFVAMQPNGEAADVIVGAHDWLGQLVTNGVVAPVEYADIAGDFAPAAIQAVTYNSTVYGLPYAVENIALLRNDDVTTADIPDTFDGLIELSQSLGTKYPVMVQQDAAAGDPYMLYPLQTSFGAPVFQSDADGNYTADLGMAGDEGLAFANYLKKLGADGVINASNGYDQVLNAFIAGETGFIVGGPWMIADIKAAGVNVSVHPIPSAGGQAAQPFLGVQAFFINADASNPIAANEFVVNYLSSQDVQVALYEVGDRTPALTAAAEAVGDNPVQAGFAQAGVNGAPMPAIPQMSAVWEFWGATEIGIASDAGDPASLWQTMTDNVVKAIG